MELNNATVFSILDMNEVYHQLELEQSSRHITTFYGTSTQLRYTRLNYGTISALDIFDKAINDTITGLNGLLHIPDYFIIFGRSESEHNTALRAFLTRLKRMLSHAQSKKVQDRCTGNRVLRFAVQQRRSIAICQQDRSASKHGPTDECE